MTSKATKRTSAHEPDAELGHLLEDAASAPPETRIEYRDRIAAHGADAVVAMEAWVEQGRSPGFAIAVLEAVGKAADDAGAAAGPPPDREQGAGLGGHRAAGIGADRGVGPGRCRGAVPVGRAGCRRRHTRPPGRRRPWKAPAPSRTATGPRATTPAGMRSRAAGPARRTGRPRRARPSPRDRARAPGLPASPLSLAALLAGRVLRQHGRALDDGDGRVLERPDGHPDDPVRAHDLDSQP